MLDEHVSLIVKVLDSPCKDVLGMVVSEVDLGRASERDTQTLTLDHLHELRFCVR
jgi:hypothetical protein